MNRMRAHTLHRDLVVSTIGSRDEPVIGLVRRPVREKLCSNGIRQIKELGAVENVVIPIEWHTPRLVLARRDHKEGFHDRTICLMLARLYPYWRPTWDDTALGSLLLVLAAGFEILQPWPIKWLVDYVLAADPHPVGWGHGGRPSPQATGMDWDIEEAARRAQADEFIRSLPPWV
jgi:hypothetical protein